jgi:hypothetical protein
MAGTTFMDGSLDPAFIRDSPPSESVQQTASWTTETDQTVDYYKLGTCPGDDLTLCEICTARYTAPSHPVDVELRIQERSADTATVLAWIYNEPNASEEQFNLTDCQSVEGLNSPNPGMTPILITLTPDGSTLEVAPAPDPQSGELNDYYQTWSIEPLP